MKWVDECKNGSAGRWQARRRFKTKVEAFAWVNAQSDWRLQWNVRRVDTQSD